MGVFVRVGGETRKNLTIIIPICIIIFNIYSVVLCSCSPQEPLQLRVGITMSPKNGVFLRIASH